MRQLIARIDDGLHDRLRARAAAEGRSMNSVVVEALSGAAPPLDRRAHLRARMAAAGTLWQPPAAEGEVLSREALRAAGQGSGTAVSEALAAERAAR